VNHNDTNKGTTMDDNRAAIESAMACLKEAQAEIAREFELDHETNLYGKQLPDWVASIAMSVHAAREHLLNAAHPIV
jgi:hypothetical protein